MDLFLGTDTPRLIPSLLILDYEWISALLRKQRCSNIESANVSHK